jgi:hypothetical protein
MTSRMAFTDTQRYTNYTQLVKTIEFLDKNGRITEDWVVEHTKRILQYREWLPNFGVINDDVDDPTFRYKCEETEEMMRFNCESIRLHRTFDLRVYYGMLTNMKYICDTVFSEDELIQCMELLTF